jgi:cytochrome bd-type quinol oxidase subunit 2
MSLKHLLYSLAWMVPVVGGMLSLCLLLCAPHSLRAAHHYWPAFLLSALGVMIAGLGFWLLNGGSRRLSMVAMLMATLLLVTGIVLIFRHLPPSGSLGEE